MMALGGFLRTYRMPDIFGGTVADPFLPSKLKLNLFYSGDYRNWVWYNAATNDLVYLQYWNNEQQKELVLWYPSGLNSQAASPYDFQIFQCIETLYNF